MFQIGTIFYKILLQMKKINTEFITGTDFYIPGYVKVSDSLRAILHHNSKSFESVILP